MLRYAASIFLGAFLLFQVQPLIARYILPWFGGTPAVWTTCMLFFQLLLLLGYLYAHLVISRLKPRAQAIVHSLVLVASIATIVLMAVAWGTPIVPTAAWKPQTSDLPVLRILMLLGVAVGLPYLVLSTTSPLLQAWFSRTQAGASPYRLYTLSNAGSLLALLTYPVLVEPHLALRAQAGMWSWAFVAYALMAIYCAAVLWRLNPSPDPKPEESEASPADAAPPTTWLKVLWIALPAGASTLLLATTNQLSQDIAVVPFLWILPLGLYLLSFILCFDNEKWYSRRAYMIAMTVALPVMAYVMLKGIEFPIVAQAGVYAAVLFICCMVCHGELVALKPSPKYLTSFYLAISIGGALGGLFVGIVAPLIFNSYWELQIALVFCAAVGIGVLLYHKQPWAPLSKPLGAVFGLAAVVILAAPVYNDRDTTVLPGSRSRNFYGILQVEEFSKGDAAKARYVLRHGRIWHGWQFLNPARRRLATSYYGTNSGVGLAIACHPRRLSPNPADRSLRIGIVGLGTGTLATYGRPGDYLRFYEINPAVPKLSDPGAFFTYLGDCRGKVDIAMGDARISLERELAQHDPQRFDVLALDAFSSDSIPIHLLTLECMKIYLAHMRDSDGIIAVHISNRCLDLRPVVYKLAEALNLSAALISAPGVTDVSYHSDWVLLSRDPAELAYPDIAAATTKPTDLPKVGVWTDDYHNLFQIIKWRQ
jgi:hypothetical protein